MKELLGILNALLDSTNKLIASPPAVIALVLFTIIVLLLWKLVKYLINYTLKHAAKLGHAESIAVGYKVLHEKTSPEQALRDIKRELDEL